ncbi:uncharacterized protein LY79DRAFT_570044 [Colletotrichum navitas]|uniref:Uncharacterized protein n=1 Tax=Colletotrichum navitas TaxID=681940 RepID=A0AAD8PNA3_9PEZI|nr:uncharacterized protein LY79DRAFT_570044 [Colletotrichum navitas]KAK1570278.1 hypothetical protein LY79DRAFT_570044 [Colletotrichum navitas]
MLRLLAWVSAVLFFDFLLLLSWSLGAVCHGPCRSGMCTVSRGSFWSGRRGYWTLTDIQLGDIQSVGRFMRRAGRDPVMDHRGRVPGWLGMELYKSRPGQSCPELYELLKVLEDILVRVSRWRRLMQTESLEMFSTPQHTPPPPPPNSPLF